MVLGILILSQEPALLCAGLLCRNMGGIIGPPGLTARDEGDGNGSIAHRHEGIGHTVGDGEGDGVTAERGNGQGHAFHGVVLCVTGLYPQGGARGHSHRGAGHRVSQRISRAVQAGQAENGICPVSVDLCLVLRQSGMSLESQAKIGVSRRLAGELHLYNDVISGHIEVGRPAAGNTQLQQRQQSIGVAHRPGSDYNIGPRLAGEGDHHVLPFTAHAPDVAIDSGAFGAVDDVRGVAGQAALIHQLHSGGVEAILRFSCLVGQEHSKDGVLRRHGLHSALCSADDRCRRAILRPEHHGPPGGGGHGNGLDHRAGIGQTSGGDKLAGAQPGDLCAVCVYSCSPCRHGGPTAGSTGIHDLEGGGQIATLALLYSDNDAGIPGRHGEGIGTTGDLGHHGGLAALRHPGEGDPIQLVAVPDGDDHRDGFTYIQDERRAGNTVADGGDLLLRSSAAGHDCLGDTGVYACNQRIFHCDDGAVLSVSRFLICVGKGHIDVGGTGGHDEPGLTGSGGAGCVGPIEILQLAGAGGLTGDHGHGLDRSVHHSIGVLDVIAVSSCDLYGHLLPGRYGDLLSVSFCDLALEAHLRRVNGRALGQGGVGQVERHRIAGTSS